MVTDAKRLANKKYRAEKRDQLAVDVPRGKRDAYKQIAAEFGLSLSMLIQNSVETFARNHAAAPDGQPAGKRHEKLSADERKLIEEFSRLSADAQKSLMKFLQAVNETKGGV